MKLTMRVSLYPAALSGALCFGMLAGPACADMRDPLSTSDATEITSQGMRSLSGDVYSQGMMAASGAWDGEIYSQGMMMSTGDVYSQGMEFMILGGTNSDATDTVANLGGTTNSPGTGTAANLGGTTPPSQGCVGTAPNCTNNVTNTPTLLNPPSNQLANLISPPAGVIAAASADPIPEPASLALLASALLWFSLVRRRRNRM